MAPESLTVAFNAKEQISSALTKADEATNGLQRGLSDLNLTMSLAEAKTEGLESEFDEMARSSRTVRAATESMERGLDSARNALASIDTVAEATEGQLDEIGRAMVVADRGSRAAERGMDGLRNSFSELAASGELPTKMLNRMGRTIASTDRSVDDLNSGLSVLAGMMNATSVASRLAADSADKLSDEINEVGRSANNASADLGVLAAVAQATSLEFSSLSINIGPFNLALKNLMVQLPLIITGMGSLLAIVTSLITAFATLTLGLSAFIAGGAVAFFEEFSAQFEDTAEAVEALMGALMDLFKDAIEPLMTEANMDLFIDSVDFLARLVNRISKAFMQMRDEILGFGETVGGDFDEFFTALRDSLVMLTPIMESFISFIAERFPDALMFFSRLTIRLSSVLGNLFNTFSSLFSQLARFAAVVLNAVVPAVQLMIGSITDFFTIINAIPDSITTAAVMLGTFAGVVLLLRSRYLSLIGIINTATAAIINNARVGAGLSRVYLGLRAALIQLIRGNIEYATAKTVASGVIKENTIAMLGNIQAKLLSISSTNVLTSALAAQIGIIQAVIAGNIGMSAALQLSAASAKRAAASAWAAVTSFVSVAASSLAAAGALAAQTAAWIALDVASGGLVPAIGALVAGLIALAGIAIAVAQDGSALAATFEGVAGSLAVVKKALLLVVDVILAILSPILNRIIAVFQFWMSILEAFGDGLLMIAGAFSTTSSSGGGLLDMLDSIRSFIMPLISAFSIFANMISLLIRAFGQLLALGIRKWFERVAYWLSRILQVLGWVAEESGALKVIGDMFDFINDMIEGALEMLDDFIDKLNQMPGVDLEGPTLEAGRVREQLMGEEEEEAGGIETEPDVNLSFEDSVEQNIDVDADPEEREQMRRVVKDALNEANSIARRQEGMGS